MVRLKMLNILKDTVITNILMYEDKLLETAVLPFLTGVESEIDRWDKLFLDHLKKELKS